MFYKVMTRKLLLLGYRISSLELYMFYKCFCLKTYCWFINIELIVNSMVTQAWARLIWCVHFDISHDMVVLHSVTLVNTSVHGGYLKLQSYIYRDTYILCICIYTCMCIYVYSMSVYDIIMLVTVWVETWRQRIIKCSAGDVHFWQLKTALSMSSNDSFI